MEILSKTVSYNESVNLWWTSEVQQSSIATENTTFEAEVNPTESYVQIIYPVRKAFLKNHSLATLPYPQTTYSHLRFPFENSRLDFSTFIHTPHHLCVTAKTWIEVEQEGTYPFDVYTCGGMKLWVDGKATAIFTPFTRNIAQRMHTALMLTKGRHELVVYAEELAERDVFFYIELRYRGELPLFNVVQVNQKRKNLEYGIEVLKSLHYERDGFEEGEVNLVYKKEIITQPVTLKLKHSDKNLTLLSKTDRVCLGNVEELPLGVFRHIYIYTVGPYHLERDLLVSFADKKRTQKIPEKTMRERKRQALTYIKETGEESITRALVFCELEGSLSDRAYSMVQTSLQKIERKEDCSDFHLVPLLLLLTHYGELLPLALKGQLEKALLAYRYWIDEPGNDCMWFFSENHAFLFHIGQYLSGFLYPESLFTCSKRKGKEQYELGKNRLEKWFSSFFAYGYSEWNSATYLPIDLLGFFTLFELAPDPEIKEMTKRALDFTFRLISLNCMQGVMSCSFGRCYEDTLKFRSLSEISFLSFVAFGEGYTTPNNRSVALFALSSYEMEEYTKEVHLETMNWMEICLQQGQAEVNTYLFRTNFYQMGSVQHYRSFEHGHQQHLFNVAIPANHPVQFFINHPGEPAFSGQNRPSYWAGNGTMPDIHQYHNLALIIFSIEEQELVHAIHAYAPLERMDTYQQSAHYFFFVCGKAYVSTYFSNPFSLTVTGANANRELISKGRDHAVVVRCASFEEFPSFEAFIANQKQQLYHFDPSQRSLRCTDSRWGTVRVSQDSFTVNDKEISIDYPREITIHTGVFDHA